MLEPLLGTNEFLLTFEPTRQPAHFLLRDLETIMNEEQEELFGQ